MNWNVLHNGHVMNLRMYGLLIMDAIYDNATSHAFEDAPLLAFHRGFLFLVR